MDNEAFRYLAAIKSGVSFGEDQDPLYKASWEKARLETDRFMEYVNQLKPHMVQETVSVNDIRRKILDLTKPLADIAKHVDITIDNLEDEKEDVRRSEGSAEEIKKKIKIKVRNKHCSKAQ